MDLIWLKCSRCGKPWQSDRDDLLQWFNHLTLHEWVHSNFNGPVEFSIRQGQPNAREAIDAWIQRELVEILSQRLSQSGYAKLQDAVFGLPASAKPPST